MSSERCTNCESRAVTRGTDLPAKWVAEGKHIADDVDAATAEQHERLVQMLILSGNCIGTPPHDRMDVNGLILTAVGSLSPGQASERPRQLWTKRGVVDR